MGTIGYMSPEQVRGKLVDHRTDIFAFGAILYEMLAGARAFRRSTSADTMAAILNEAPPSISQIAQNTPRGLQRVVDRCLEKNPEQRFQSASDLAFALEALSDAGGSAVSPAAGAKLTDGSLRKSVLSSAVVIGVLALVLFGYLVISSRNRLTSLGVSDYTQITHDGNAGGVRGTDGTRLYMFYGHGAGEVAISGGDVACESGFIGSDTTGCIAGRFKISGRVANRGDEDRTSNLERKHSGRLAAISCGGQCSIVVARRQRRGVFNFGRRHLHDTK
jgi:eukaryotic-like serine/threonine-protein kinase